MLKQLISILYHFGKPFKKIKFALAYNRSPVVKKWITADDAATRLQISRRSLYNNRHQFVYKQIGRFTLYSEESIMRASKR